MKQKLLVLFAATSLLLSPALVGCKSPPVVAYRVTSGTYTIVENAMQAWNDYVIAFRPSHAEELAVAKAYKTWQVASIAVVNTVKASLVNPGDSGVAVNATVAAVTNALAGLIDVLKPYGIILKPSV